MKRTLRILIVLLILLPFAANAQGENPVWTAERLLSDDEITRACPDAGWKPCKKAFVTLADAVALLNACIQSGRFKEIIDGSQASVPGSDTYTFSSGEACLSGDQYVDPKDFNFMTAYLLADDFTTGVLMGIPAGGPSQAIGYVELDGEVLFFDAAAQITHGRIRQFVFPRGYRIFSSGICGRIGTKAGLPHPLLDSGRTGFPLYRSWNLCHPADPERRRLLVCRERTITVIN